jgi:hypothetical protein
MSPNRDNDLEEEKALKPANSSKVLQIRNPSATRSESATTNDADPVKEIISFAGLVYCLHLPTCCAM